MQHRGEVLQPPVALGRGGRVIVVEAPGRDQVVNVGDGHGAAPGLPDLLDRRAQRRVLKAVKRLARRHHLREQGLQQFHVLVDVLDQGERVERQRGVLGELDEAAAEVAARLLVGAADVDDPDARAGAEVGGGDLVQQQRLARARGAGDRHVVVARRVVVDVDLHDLAAPPAEQKHRRARALPLGDERRQMHRVRRGLGRDALHALQIGVERCRERHRQRADQGLRHHHRVAGEFEAARTEDGARRLFGPGHRVRLGEERELQIEVDELLAVVHRLEHDVPVGLALLQVGQEARHVAGGVRGGAGGLEEGPVAGGLGVEHVHAQREQERAGVLQRALVEVADQAAGVPQREARREGAHRHQAKLGLQVGGGVGQADALAVDAQARGPVDHLVAQLAPVVVGERDGVAGLPVWVEQRGDPVDQVLRRPRTGREAGGVQRGPDPVAQQQQLLQAREILGAAGQRHTDHQPVVAEQVALRGQQ